MIEKLRLDSLVDRIATLLPGISADAGADFRKNLRAMLTNTLSRMDLVTREEFDVQTAVLARTRTRLDELEHQVKALEQALSGNQNA